MRIPIREQLSLIILITSLICLGVISVATWVTERSFVLALRSTRLSSTASLKAAQLTANLNLMQTSANFISTRVLIQASLQRYDIDGNNTDANWSAPRADLQDAIGGDGSLGAALSLQAIVFPANGSGPGGPYGVLNATSHPVNNTIKLPYRCPNGQDAFLGDNQCGNLNLGYPPNLYPNLTYTTQVDDSSSNSSIAHFDGVTIEPQSSLLLGPWQVNSSFSLVSVTVPILNNSASLDVLGFLTVVMDAGLVLQVLGSTEGLGQTGETLLVGPVDTTNLFATNLMNATGNIRDGDFLVRYVVPLNLSDEARHPGHTLGTPNLPFNASQYPVVLQAFTTSTGQSDNSGAEVKAQNEAGDKVSVGYALPETNMVDWAVLVEQARSEVWEPIDHLRNLLLACVFGTAAFMAIIAFPLAHFFSLPIRRLRAATAKSIEPPGTSESRSSLDSFDSERDEARGAEDPAAAGDALARKEGFYNPITRLRRKRQDTRERDRETQELRRRKRAFRIPGKVKEHKQFFKDELSDLTFTFNEMSDELMMQYERLEERVQQRTSELEMSKKAAEVANESKTLFIANISHELKTPLNGILGMCAVCMQEDDPIRLKRSLGIIYKSGDLLLNLLTDLLTFSRNQVGQQLTLDEREFRLHDISSQVLAIFDKQARDGQIDLRVKWEGARPRENASSSPERNELGLIDFDRVKDMILWGDTHRILQVVINLVSNSLKFTPSGGSVVLTVRCLPEAPPDFESRKGSTRSRQSKQSRQRMSRQRSPDTRADTSTIGSARSYFPLGLAGERTASPPSGKFLNFEFEVHDTGPGIPEGMHAKIFEPFVQGDLGLSKKYGGTGLGLSICSQLASLMRGTIAVDSTVGVGSTFTMRIPLRYLRSRADSSASSMLESSEGTGKREPPDGFDWNVARQSQVFIDPESEDGDRSKTTSATDAAPPSVPLNADPKPRLVGLSQPFFASSQPMESPGSQPGAMQQITAEATRGNKIRVLVAEDNKVNQEVVLRMLKLEDIYDVTVAKDGQEALDLVKESMSDTGGKRPFNLIFMDVQMPNVDGLQSTRLIREIGYQAPIVALTAFAEESNIKDCLDSGMNYFLSKPIRRPQLKKVLKQYVAPIPEENEECSAADPSRRSTDGDGATAIVVANGPSAPGPSGNDQRPTECQQPSFPPLGLLSKDPQQQPDTPGTPVSPFTIT